MNQQMNNERTNEPNEQTERMCAMRIDIDSIIEHEIRHYGKQYIISIYL